MIAQKSTKLPRFTWLQFVRHLQVRGPGHGCWEISRLWLEWQHYVGSGRKKINAAAVAYWLDASCLEVKHATMIAVSMLDADSMRALSRAFGLKRRARYMATSISGGKREPTARHYWLSVWRNSLSYHENASTCHAVLAWIKRRAAA